MAEAGPPALQYHMAGTGFADKGDQEMLIEPRLSFAVARGNEQHFEQLALPLRRAVAVRRASRSRANGIVTRPGRPDRVQSKAGRGTVFRVSLPPYRPLVPAAPAAAEGSP